MEAILEKISVDGSKRASIHYDLNPENPRDWCVRSHMVCEHPRYSLGDKSDGIINELQNLCNKYDIDCYGDWENDIEDMTAAEMFSKLREHIVIRPISIYDHSGVSIFYGNPHEYWDSGCVGFGYMEREDVEQCQSIREDEDWREIAISIMDREMEVYDKFIRGQVYGFVLEERKNPSKALTETPEWDEFLEDYWTEKFQWLEIDSCWGYYEEPEELAELVLNEQV